MLNPDMPTQELRLHMGELTEDEVLVARAAIRWANSQAEQPDAAERGDAIWALDMVKHHHDQVSESVFMTYIQTIRAALSAPRLEVVSE